MKVLAGYGMAALACALVAGCALLPGRGSSCDRPRPYQSAQEAPPLRVPSAAAAPDTRHALRVPAVRAPQIPRADDRCLDEPPSYGAGRPAGD